MSAGTRETAVTADMAAVEAKYGPEAWPQIIVALLKEISISLAMLVDK